MGIPIGYGAALENDYNLEVRGETARKTVGRFTLTNHRWHGVYEGSGLEIQYANSRPGVASSLVCVRLLLVSIKIAIES